MYSLFQHNENSKDGRTEDESNDSNIGNEVGCQDDSRAAHEKEEVSGREIVKFILRNRRATLAFQDHTIQDIIREIKYAASVGGLIVITENHEIKGFCSLEVFPKYIYVRHLLCISSAAKKIIVGMVVDRNLPVRSTRRGVQHTYPVNFIKRFYEQLS